MMKVGQMASYIEGSVPPEAQAVLARLQHQSDPMPFPVIAEVVEAAADGSDASGYRVEAGETELGRSGGRRRGRGLVPR